MLESPVDKEAEAFLNDAGPTGRSDNQAVVETAENIVERYGEEAPLRAELAAQNALATGNLAAYRLFKRVEGAAENLLLLHPQSHDALGAASPTA